ncbi:MAG: hypothetical protein ABEI77_02655 [Halorientalis sp.]
MDILVVSPCSADKRFDPIGDCETIDTHSRTELVEQYPEQVAPAAELYTGEEHQHVSSAVDTLSEIAAVDWAIISAGFGLVQAETELPSYECAFSEIESVRRRARRMGYNVADLTNDETVKAVGREKDIPQAFSDKVTTGYDLVFVVLSEPYLLSVAQALAEIPDQTTAFALASKGSKHLISECTWIPATEAERQELGTTWMRLRGALLQELAESTAVEELERLAANPDYVQEITFSSTS